MTTEFTITVSRPCAALRSNGGHGNRYVINDARKAAKWEGMTSVIAEIGTNDAGLHDSKGIAVNISYTELLGPRERAMDDDNLIGAMKPYRDGIALALGINDRRMTTHPCGTAERGEVSGVRVRVWWESESGEGK